MSADAPACLVTGGGTGIGAAVARVLASRGWRVAVNGRRAAPLEEVAAETGGIALPGDTSEADVAAGVVAAAVERLGRLDALVLNAGTARSGDVLGQTPESFSLVLRTNVEGPFHLARAALPHLLERQGAIVTVASLAGLRVARESAAYCTSKAAAIMLTRTIAMDFGPRGVRANVVCPAWTRTDMADRAMDALAGMRGTDREEAYAAANRHVPLRRPADAQEVAEAVAWLASPAASYVNGAVLTVDGGAALVDAGGLAFDVG